MTKAALKGCLGLPPALAPRGEISGCSQVPVPKTISMFVAPWDSTATRDPSLPPWTLISHISQTECGPPCPPAPTTIPHVNCRWYLHLRLRLSKNLSYPQNPGQLPPTDAELKSAGAGEGHQALGSVGHSLQPEGPRQQQKAIARGNREEGEKGTHVRAVWATAG